MSVVKYQDLVFILLLIIFYQIKTDLPVHCRAKKIVGEWIFRINTERFDLSLKKDSSCGHGMPDKVDETIGDTDYSFSSFTDIKISIRDDYQVFENNERIGKWTPVYDEGFILYYKNSQFTAFMKYYKDNKNAYKSNCNKTMMGWFIQDINNKHLNWSCFFGFKVEKKNSPSSFLQINSLVKESEETIFYLRSDTLKEDSLINHLKYEDNKHFIDNLNSHNLSWRAEINQEFKGLSLFQLYSKFGSRSRFVKHKGYKSEIVEHLSVKTQLIQKNTIQKDLDSNLVFNYKEVSKYFDFELDDIPTDSLSSNWDWRNVGGINYVPKPRKQGSCGSCYTISVIESLNSRLRIMTNNKDKTKFSAQFSISCNFYSEGCEGGYPIMVAKFFNEFEIIPENCFRYQHKNIDCSNVCDYSKFSKKYTTEKYEYLGGHYGATSEELMMKEIRARGPIPGNLMIKHDFYYYRSGIYSHSHKSESRDKISTQTLNSRNLDWAEVQHSILIVGWGEENGEKYWICMNSWGKVFGENGFFRILRGVNECNIETMGDTFRLKIEYRIIN